MCQYQTISVYTYHCASVLTRYKFLFHAEQPIDSPSGELELCFGYFSTGCKFTTILNRLLCLLQMDFNEKINMKQHFKFSENPCICSGLCVNSGPHYSIRGFGEKCERKNYNFTFLFGIIRIKTSISSFLPITRCLHLFRLKAMEACPPFGVEQGVMNPKLPSSAMEIYLVCVGPAHKITSF